MTRARMCEVISEKLGYDDTNSFFTTGLFSTLDAMFDKPMQSLLQEISISENIQEALLKGSGDHGKVLSDVLNYEKATWSGDFTPNTIDYRNLMQVYVDSIEWTDKYLATIKA